MTMTIADARVVREYVEAIEALGENATVSGGFIRDAQRDLSRLLHMMHYFRFFSADHEDLRQAIRAHAATFEMAKDPLVLHVLKRLDHDEHRMHEQSSAVSGPVAACTTAGMTAPG